MKNVSMFAFVAVCLMSHTTHATLAAGDNPADEVGGRINLVYEISPTDDLAYNESSNVVYVASNDKAVRKGGCQTFTGGASIYGLNQGSGDGAHQALAGGGHLNTSAMTAAMKPPVPLHTYVYVTNIQTGKKIKVYVNDRGPYVRGRIIDLTPAAARAIGDSGVIPVKVSTCDI